MSRIRSVERRLIILLVIIFVCMMGIAGRLFFVQAVSATKYKKEAEQQRLSVIEIPPKRGAILDRNGNELAVSVTLDTIYATPYLIKDREGFAKKIAPILKVNEHELLDRLLKQENFVYLARKVDSQTVQEVKKVVRQDHIKGIGFLKESSRYYPDQSLGAHVLGFVGMDNKGLAGLELYYNKVLSGRPGYIKAEHDAVGRPIPQSTQRYRKAEDGSNIRISIDREIQYEAEAELTAAVQKYKAKSGSVIVMSPKNGEIYAMANVPSYDPNQLGTVNNTNSRNIAITDLYEPGSTMKAVTGCGALEEGLCNPSTQFYLEPTIQIGPNSVRDAHSRPAETLTFSQIIQQSSNVGMAKIGLAMGRSKIVRYLEKFGFNRKTGVDFPGEATGYYPNAANWLPISSADISFGQGIATTQLRMADAFATIANGGVPVRPHFLLDVTNPQGKVTESTAVAQEQRIVDPKICEEMRNILENVVLDGTGTEAKVLNYTVGGKTGTAQEAKVNGRGYSKDKYVASFIGMIPIRDPKLIISVVVNEPQGNIYYGGSIAAPVFSKIAEFAMRYLKIPPQ